jgi:hypothetical protein
MAIQLKRNDTKDTISYTMTYADGTPVNLTGATVRFVMGKGKTLIANSAATIISASAGKVEYTLKESDTLVAGNYNAEFEVTFSTGKVKTFPSDGYISIKIQPNVDGEQSTYIEDQIAYRVSDIQILKNSIQAQLDQFAVGASNEETAQSRVEADGTVNATLKARLDKKETKFATDIESLSSSLAQNAKKTKGIISIEEFGAATTKTASENTTAITNAIASMTKGDTLLIPSGDFNITNVVFNPPDDCKLVCYGRLISSADGVAVQIGHSTAARFRYVVKELKVLTISGGEPASGLTWTAGSVGVKVVNVFMCDIDIRDVYGFETNILFKGQNGIGNSLNEVHLGRLRNAKKTLHLSADTNGYCNENTFYGGSFQFGSNLASFTDTVHLTVDHYSTHLLDNNHFIRPAFESPSATSKCAVLSGDRGSIFMPRSEGSKIFEFTSNATYWYLIGTFVNRVDIVNNGIQTKIFDNETITFNGRNDTGGIITAHNRAGNASDVFVGLAFDRTKTFRVDGNGRMYTSSFGILFGGGNGNPEGVITAPVGSVWSRTDGGLGANLYLKNSGTGNTGWLALHPLTSGTTANRPLLPPNPYMYFDTTLNKPIFHRGSNVWVDSTGTVV